MDSFNLLASKFNVSSNDGTFRRMQDFILLWMVFEKEVLALKTESRQGDKTAGNRKRVTTELKNLSRHLPVNNINKKILDRVYSKQKEWYADSNNLDNICRTFYLNSEQKNLVKKVFSENSPSSEELFEAVITVVYKYRCNFIHGDKELKDLHTRQYDRFSLYNELLIECITAKGKLNRKK